MTEWHEREMTPLLLTMTHLRLHINQPAKMLTGAQSLCHASFHVFLNVYACMFSVRPTVCYSSVCHSRACPLASDRLLARKLTPSDSGPHHCRWGRFNGLQLAKYRAHNRLSVNATTCPTHTANDIIVSPGGKQIKRRWNRHLVGHQLEWICWWHSGKLRGLMQDIRSVFSPLIPYRLFMCCQLKIDQMHMKKAAGPCPTHTD